ncbi:Uncharacterised protein [Vibrio cholerae]|nr:Uncharacterised protein [Vibrio cholerae]CSD05318.1 Uncharacterised protein [Vibrio cholerae]
MTTAPDKIPNATPTSNSLAVVKRNLRAITTKSNVNSSAPNTAAAIKATGEFKLGKNSSRITIATLAPPDTPTTPGSASTLPSNTCKVAPATAREAPMTAAASNLGKRSSHTNCCSREDQAEKGDSHSSPTNK